MHEYVKLRVLRGDRSKMQICNLNVYKPPGRALHFYIFYDKMRHNALSRVITVPLMYPVAYVRLRKEEKKVDRILRLRRKSRSRKRRIRGRTCGYLPLERRVSRSETALHIL